MAYRYSVPDVARAFLVHEKTVRAWIARGWLRASKNRPYKIRRAALQRAMFHPQIFPYLSKACGGGKVSFDKDPVTDRRELIVSSKK